MLKDMPHLTLFTARLYRDGSLQKAWDLAQRGESTDYADGARYTDQQGVRMQKLQIWYDEPSLPSPSVLIVSSLN